MFQRARSRKPATKNPGKTFQDRAELLELQLMDLKTVSMSDLFFNYGA